MFGASLRDGSLNARLANLAADAIARHGGSVDVASMAEFDCPSDHHVGAVDAGTITGVGGGVLRDMLLGEIPVVLRSGLYAIPALVGAAIVVAAWESGTRSLVFPILAAAVCFAIRLAGLHLDLNVPRAPGDPERE